MAEKIDIKSVEEEKETPWYVRLIITAFLFGFFCGGPFFIYRFGNFIYSDDFFWQSDNRIYLIIAFIFVYVGLVFLLVFKWSSSLHDKKSVPASTGLSTSIRDMLSRNKIEDSEYYDGTASPTKMKKYMEDIVESEKRN